MAMTVSDFWNTVTNAAGCAPLPPETVAEMVTLAFSSEYAGTPEAHAMQAARFLYGWKGTNRPDYVAAFNCAGQAAKKGHPWGHFYVGVCLYMGLGTTQDHAKAYKALCKAQFVMDDVPYDDNCPLAACDLGLMLLWGHGVEANPNRALLFFNAAASANVPMGLFLLGHCYATGSGCGQDFAMARHCYQQAAKLGHIKAAEELARMPPE